MSYTNVNIDTEFSQRTKWRIERTRLETELAIYKEFYSNLLTQIENIPKAIKEYGYIDFSIDNEASIRLIKKPDPQTSEGDIQMNENNGKIVK